MYRIGSNIFPWFEEYQETDLPDYQHIVLALREAGDIIMASGMRVSFHPDHFVKLASSKPEVVKRSLNNLHHHNLLFDMMGIPANHYYPLNIHVGMNFTLEVVDRFIDRFRMLNDDTKTRLVVENDDKANSFSVKQLFDHIHMIINIPITFDYFHHTFHPDGLTSHGAAHLASTTWDCTPLFHYSESKNLNEGVSGNPRAHSDYALNCIDDYHLNIDIDLETKAKELAWLKTTNTYNQIDQYKFQTRNNELISVSKDEVPIEVREKAHIFFDKIIKSNVYLKVENTSQKENKIFEVQLSIPGDVIVIKKVSKTFEEGLDACEWPWTSTIINSSPRR